MWNIKYVVKIIDIANIQYIPVKVGGKLSLRVHQDSVRLMQVKCYSVTKIQ